MHLSGFLRVGLYTLGLILYRFCQAIFSIIQALYWAFSGTRQAVKESKLQENYERSVQVMHVVTWFRMDPLQIVSLSDFVLTHERFESPDYIFDNDHVTLMTINDDVAIFAEALPGQELWRSEFNAFIRLAQVDNCKRLLIVPMASFHRMSERLGEPRHPVFFLFNTARCGSTLLTQMLEYTGKCVTLSEPDLLNMLAEWYRKRGQTQQLKDVTRNCLRWICRPYRSIEPSCYIVKLTAPGIWGLRLYHELFPSSRCLFMYRGIEKTAKSLYRLAQELPSLKLAIFFGKFHGYFVEFFINALGLCGKQYRMKLEDDIDFGMVVWLAACREYINFRRSGFQIDAIRYEDIIEDPRNAAITILEFCNLPVSVVDRALKGLEVDSQRNSPISKEILGRHSNCPMTERAGKKFNELLKKNELPPIEGDGVIEGTITHKK